MQHKLIATSIKGFFFVVTETETGVSLSTRYYYRILNTQFICSSSSECNPNSENRVRTPHAVKAFTTHRIDMQTLVSKHFDFIKLFSSYHQFNVTADNYQEVLSNILTLCKTIIVDLKSKLSSIIESYEQEIILETTKNHIFNNLPNQI